MKVNEFIKELESVEKDTEILFELDNGINTINEIIGYSIDPLGRIVVTLQVDSNYKEIEKLQIEEDINELKKELLEKEERLRRFINVKNLRGD